MIGSTVTVTVSTIPHRRLASSFVDVGMMPANSLGDIRLIELGSSDNISLRSFEGCRQLKWQPWSNADAAAHLRQTRAIINVNDKGR